MFTSTTPAAAQLIVLCKHGLYLTLLLTLATTCTSSSGMGGSGFGGGGSFSSGCVSHADCGAQLVCVSAACQSAFPRTYVFTFRSATIAKYKNNGKNWDAFGGAPDPQARLQVDGKVVCQTSVVQDSFDPVWNQSCEVELFQTSKVTFALWDADVAADDVIGGINGGAPLLDRFIKAGEFRAGTTLKAIEFFNIGIALK